MMKGHCVLHPAFLNQSRVSGHYNFRRLLESPGAGFLLSPAAIRRHLCGVELSAKEIRQAVCAALAEDIGSGDATTLATVPENLAARAVTRAREALVVAGIAFAEESFRQTASASSPIGLIRRKNDGARAKAGDVLMEISGPARAILSAERVALNFVQRLSGIATLTAQFVGAIKGTPRANSRHAQNHARLAAF